jgi:hypothetical protein
MQDAKAGPEYSPVLQSSHAVLLVAPFEALYFPASQSSHVASLVAAVAVLYLPLEHIEHATDSSSDAAFTRYFPAGQGVQEEEERDPRRENSPASQNEHAKDSSPVAALMRTFPPAQAVQEREAGPE